MRQERVCLGCGACFEVEKPSNPKRYCTHACSAKFRKEPTKQLQCEICGMVFMFKGRTKAKYCVACRKKVRVQCVVKSRIKRGLLERPGVGSGGNQLGNKNPNSLVRREKRQKALTAYRKTCYRYWEHQCVLCGASNHLEVNHIDRDTRNDSPENLVPLCRSCHRGIHRMARKTRRSCEDILFSLWLDGRIKIAEKIGDAENAKPIRPEGSG